MPVSLNPYSSPQGGSSGSPIRISRVVAALICVIAAIGFAFDTYVLLLMPLIARPALGELLHVDPTTAAGNAAVLRWTGYIMWSSAICGGVFGLLGGYLTDLLGRRRVLTWSILIYAISSTAAAWSTSAEMLLVLRCTTFIGVCVEFVAAVAWLSELFPDPHRREAVLGYTQAFGSIGGLLVTGAYKGAVTLAGTVPAWGPFQGDSAWRYAFISGLIPALPLLLIRPFLPESPVWQQKHAAGTLKRPRLSEIFAGRFRRTTIVTTILFACGFGAAFGAIQITPQIVPGLLPTTPQIAALRGKLDKAKPGTPEYIAIKKEMGPLARDQQQTIGNVQLYQEVGGLVGRFFLAWLALRIVSRQKLLRLFQVPGLLLIPLVYGLAAAGHLGSSSLEVLKWGMFVAGFCTVAQFSFWGNYLPRVYPTHIRGTGESFSANVGGRMLGTGFNFVTTQFAVMILAATPGMPSSKGLAYAAAGVVLAVYAIGLITSFWLPEPTPEMQVD
jgi:MFS family permease